MTRHCERSAAVHHALQKVMDRRASLAMTGIGARKGLGALTQQMPVNVKPRSTLGLIAYEQLTLIRRASFGRLGQ